MSPMIDYNLHLINDLLPYSFCCRGGNRCAQYYRSRPSMVEGAPEYVLPVPGTYTYVVSQLIHDDEFN